MLLYQLSICFHSNPSSFSSLILDSIVIPYPSPPSTGFLLILWILYIFSFNFGILESLNSIQLIYSYSYFDTIQGLAQSPSFPFLITFQNGGQVLNKRLNVMCPFCRSPQIHHNITSTKNWIFRVVSLQFQSQWSNRIWIIHLTMDWFNSLCLRLTSYQFNCCNVNIMVSDYYSISVSIVF